MDTNIQYSSDKSSTTSYLLVFATYLIGGAIFASIICVIVFFLDIFILARLGGYFILLLFIIIPFTWVVSAFISRDIIYKYLSKRKIGIMLTEKNLERIGIISLILLLLLTVLIFTLIPNFIFGGLMNG